MYRRRFALVALSEAAGSVAVDTIALLPDSELYAGVGREGGVEYLEEQVYRMGRSTYVGADGVRLFIGTNERHEIAEYGANGPVRLIRTNVPARPITDSLKQRFRDGYADLMRGLLRNPEYVDEYIENLNRWRIADEFEHHGALRVGTDGTLWVEEPWMLPDDPRRYVVHDSTGRAIARAELPPRVTPFSLGANGVLGVWKDELDLPQVMVWRVQSAGE